MSVLCRLRVNSLESHPSGTNVNMTAIHSPQDVEDDETLAEIKSFFEATPGASLTMCIRNQMAEEQFQIGDEFYVRLEKIPEAKTVQAIYAKKHAVYEAEQKAKREADDAAT